MAPDKLIETPARKCKLKSEAPPEIPKYENSVPNIACPTPRPAGDIGMAMAINPSGMKVYAC